MAEPNEIDRALQDVRELYEGSLTEHGVDSPSVGWKDEASHQLRLEILARLLPDDDQPASIEVNDFGCGYGALFGLIDEMPNVRLQRYFGYDISEEMLSTAREFIDDPRAELIKSSTVTKEADYSFVSGTFNVKMESTDEAWDAYVKSQILDLAEHSRRGFAFNLLTSYVDWKQDNLFYADPMEFFDFCKRNVSKYVSLIHDYPLFEWSLLVTKP